MASLKGLVMCVNTVNKHGFGTKSESLLGMSSMGSGIRRPYWGQAAKKGPLGKPPNSGIAVDVRRLYPLDFRCNSSMSSTERDEDYIDSTVLEAVEVRSGTEGFLIKMRDGRHVTCVHNNPQSGYLPEYAPQPAIVLKMEDGSNLLLPIIVLELPCAMLMEALRSVHVVRPTIYHVLKDTIEMMGLKVKRVRVTKRVNEAYYAELYLNKIDGEDIQEVRLDLRPSDAINIAVRCQVPIQVNRQLAYGDGVRIVDECSPQSQKKSSSTISSTLDRPESGTCIEAEEFDLVRSMIIATAEERYKDAAHLRDQLKNFRSRVDKRY